MKKRILQIDYMIILITIDDKNGSIWPKNDKNMKIIDFVGSVQGHWCVILYTMTDHQLQWIHCVFSINTSHMGVVDEKIE